MVRWLSSRKEMLIQEFLRENSMVAFLSGHQKCNYGEDDRWRPEPPIYTDRTIGDQLLASFGKAVTRAKKEDDEFHQNQKLLESVTNK